MTRFTIYDLRFTIWGLWVLWVLFVPGVKAATTIKPFELPTTNRVAGTNIIVVGVHGGTNGVKGVLVHNFFSNATFLGTATFEAAAFSGQVTIPNLNTTNLITTTNILVGTNELRFTNECYTTANQNTNVVVVSGAGTAAANGNYTNGGGGLYLKTSTTNGIRFDGLDWLLTNASGATLYSVTADYPTNTGGWVVGTGAAPAPSSIYDSITNCFTVLASSAGLSLPMITSNLYVDAFIGNDTNALRGRVDRPWKNVQPALLATRPGDTVIVGPGTFPAISSYGTAFYVSNGVNLIGSGRCVTILGTPGGSDDSIALGGTATVRELTMHGIINVGQATPTCTNALAESVEVIGAADAIYLSDWDTSFTVVNSALVSLYDGIADWEVAPGGSNRVIRIVNTTITCTNGAAGLNYPRRCIEGGDNRIEMYGGSLDCRDGNIHNSCVRLDIATNRTNKTGSVLLSNVRLFHSSTNTGFSMQVSNFNRLPVFLDNCTPEIFVPVLVTGSFTNGWEHRDIAFPNGAARTNRLVDTRSLTNALVAASEQGHRVTITDDGRTASGTNIYIYPSANQTILGQTWTNIATDGGSLTLMIRGTNWVPVAKFP